ncbi:hypothetical protein QP166_14010 [Sphingomonas sp. LR60]|uniref:hypothetical protein n=1 Tax=Sphingomonas sp. LR60 TaxID=3050233 RepID=UPI002FDF36BC
MPRQFSRFALKAAIDDPVANTVTFAAQKTMYGGKTITPGDRIFLFASETHGGRGLVARGIVAAAVVTPRTDAPRQTPRVSVTIRVDGVATRPCGRRELRPWREGPEDAPQFELDFKLYRQATDKIVGLSDATAGWLEQFF